MESLVLTHYTSSAEAVGSILRVGFFFSFRPTKTFDQLFRAAGLDAQEPDDKGMVCFTELNVEDATMHRSEFGSFGIAVSKVWAIDQGARRVSYVEPGGPHFQALLGKLRGHAPRHAFGYPVDEQRMPMFEKSLRQLLLGRKAAATLFGADAEYRRLLDDLLWVQISSDQNQAEWRIRNPSSLGGIQDAIRAGLHSVESMISWMAAAPLEVRRHCLLLVPPEAVRFLVTPRGARSELLELLMQTRFADVRVIELSG